MKFHRREPHAREWFRPIFYIIIILLKISVHKCSACTYIYIYEYAFKRFDKTIISFLRARVCAKWRPTKNTHNKNAMNGIEQSK